MYYLVVVLIVTLAAAFSAMPMWLCPVGFLIFVSGVFSHALRTRQWFSWQRDEPMGPGELRVCATGALVMAIPLLVVLVRTR